MKNQAENPYNRLRKLIREEINKQNLTFKRLNEESDRFIEKSYIFTASNTENVRKDIVELIYRNFGKPIKKGSVTLNVTLPSYYQYRPYDNKDSGKIYVNVGVLKNSYPKKDISDFFKDISQLKNEYKSGFN